MVQINTQSRKIPAVFTISRVVLPSPASQGCLCGGFPPWVITYSHYPNPILVDNRLLLCISGVSGFQMVTLGDIGW